MIVSSGEELEPSWSTASTSCCHVCLLLWTWLL